MPVATRSRAEGALQRPLNLPRDSPAVTRSRAKPDQKTKLLDLPLEIVTEICRYVIANSSPASSHICFENCHKSSYECLVKRVTMRYWAKKKAKYILFSRKSCPPLLLVNKRLSKEAVKHIPQNQVFEIGRCCSAKFFNIDNHKSEHKFICLDRFIRTMPNDCIPKSTEFVMGRPVYPEDFDEIKASIRQKLDAAYGPDVKMRIEKEDYCSEYGL